MISEKEQKIVGVWMTKIEQGKKYKEEFARSEEWPKFREYYRGDWQEGVNPVNKVFSFCRATVAASYFRNPRITVTALQSKFSKNQKIVEAVDNYLADEMNVKSAIKRAAQDAFITGTGVIKIGFDSEYGYIPSMVALDDGETITQVSTKDGSDIEYNVAIKPAFPWVLRVRPEAIITPYGYSDPRSFPWIVEEIIRPLEDVQADQKYKNTKDLSGGYQVGNEDSAFAETASTIKDETEEPQNMALLYEIRNLKDKRFIVICEDRILLDVADALQIEGMPYEFIRFNEDPDHFWGLSDVKKIEPQQLELNSIRHQAALHRRLATIKILHRKGAFSKEDLASLIKGDSPEVHIEVQGNEPLSDVVAIVTPQIPPDLKQEAALIERDMQDTIGYSSNQLGGFAGRSTPPSASEVGEVRKAASLRDDERRDITADCLKSIMRKVNQFIFSFWTKTKIIPIVGEKGAMEWVEYSGESLRGEYALRVDPNDGLPISQASRYQQAEKLFSMFGGSPHVDQRTLHEVVLGEYRWIDPSWPFILNVPQNTPWVQTGGGAPGTPGGPPSKTPQRPPDQAEVLKG